MILEAVWDAVLDSLKILPFLFLTYLLMEYLESRTQGYVKTAVRKAGWLGPLWGGTLGMIPQCGFSAAASNLYAGRAISLGTLLAIFLATSDEMIPIMISESVPFLSMMQIVMVKAGIGIIFGFITDAVCHITKNQNTGQPEDEGELKIERLCEKEHCHCEEGSIIRSALHHTIHIILFILAITVILNLAFAFVGEERLILVMGRMPVGGIFLAALIGLIPNCGSSVLLTQMYLHGVMGASQLIAGLLVGAGVGLLVLYRVNPDQKENLLITAILYGFGVLGGLLVRLVLN